MKTNYANGDVYSASDVNDTNGTINLLGQSVAYTAGKNKILNSAAQIWQRGTSVTTSSGYTADRFAEVSGNSIVYTRSTDVPSNLGFQYSISRVGIASNMVQRIEAANAAQLAGQTVTLSFYYKSTDGTGNFQTLFYYANSADNFCGVTQIGSTQTIATPATSWTRVSYTYTSISANAANGLAVYFARGGASTSTTLITGVQLEIGSTATAFQTATGTIQGELAACQRYYYRYVSASLYTYFAPGNIISTTSCKFVVKMPVTMRTAPSFAVTSPTNLQCYAASGANLTALALDQSNPDVVGLGGTAVGLGAGQGALLLGSNSTAPFLEFSSEL
jgi:hypothetical protein